VPRKSLKNIAGAGFLLLLESAVFDGRLECARVAYLVRGKGFRFLGEEFLTERARPQKESVIRSGIPQV